MGSGGAGMSVYVGGSGGIATTSEEVKWGTTQTRLFDIDKFCLFRVTRGCKEKNNRAICRMEGCQILLCYSADAKPKKADEHMPIWHLLHFSFLFFPIPASSVDTKHLSRFF